MFSEISTRSCPLKGFWTSDVEYSVSNFLTYCSYEHLICKSLPLKAFVLINYTSVNAYVR